MEPIFFHSFITLEKAVHPQAAIEIHVSSVIWTEKEHFKLPHNLKNFVHCCMFLNVSGGLESHVLTQITLCLANVCPLL